MNKLSTALLAAALFLSSTLVISAFASTITWIAPGVQVNGSTVEYEWEPHIVAKRGTSGNLAVDV